METYGWVGRLQALDHTFLMNERRKLDVKYAAAEFLWYMNRDSPLDMISHYAPQYVKFAESTGQVWGAYGRRFVDLLSTLVTELGDRNTRRAVVPLYQPKDLISAGHVKDTPCTLTWNFLFNERDELCLIANMRSNDMWLGFPYDVFVNTCVQRFVADLLGVNTGWYQHQVANMHLYARNLAAADEALMRMPEIGEPFRDRSPCGMEDIELAIGMEAMYRTHNSTYTNQLPKSWLGDLTAVLIDQPDDIEWSTLRNAYHRRG